MTREPKYYCIKTLLNPDFNNEIIFEKDKWYNSADFYDDGNPNIYEIGMCLENQPNTGLSFIVTPNPNKPNSLLFSDYFASLKKMRKLKLQKINSL